MVENVFRVAVDPIFPPPSFPKSKKHLVPENIYESNKFELIFDENDAAALHMLPSKSTQSNYSFLSSILNPQNIFLGQLEGGVVDEWWFMYSHFILISSWNRRRRFRWRRNVSKSRRGGGGRKTTKSSVIGRWTSILR